MQWRKRDLASRAWGLGSIMVGDERVDKQEVPGRLGKEEVEVLMGRGLEHFSLAFRAQFYSWQDHGGQGRSLERPDSGITSFRSQQPWPQGTLRTNSHLLLTAVFISL